MSRIEVWAALAAALTLAIPALAAHLRGVPRRTPGRGARLLLWIAIAAPLLFLLTYEGDRFRVYVRGANGVFEAFRLLAFSAAAGAAVTSLRPIACRWWSTLLLVFLASTLGLVTAALLVR